MRLVLLGPPGAGKGTQARMLETRLGAPQVASGDLLRSAVRNKSALGLEAKGFMDKGALVPDELVLKLVDARLQQPDALKGFILDGYPRTVSQAETLAKMLEVRGEKLDWVVAIDVPDEELIKRISGRRTCRNCGAMFHVIYDPPRNINVCNSCNGELYQRDDDAEDTVRMRLQVYAASTRPLLEHYARLGLLAPIDGIGRAEEIEGRILKAIGQDASPEKGEGLITLKSRDEIAVMRRASRIVAEVLDQLVAAAKAGVTTLELDRLAEELTLKKGARPAFKGYQPGAVVYRHSLCVSINEEIVHGIPKAGRKLKPGDIVGLDFGVVYQGYYGDAARTVAIGKVSASAERLMKVTRDSLYAGIEQARVGNRIGDIARAVQRTAEDAGFAVVTDFAGHGIGRKLHEDPQVPNYFRPGMPNPRLQEGMVLAIEPMINEGTAELEILDDGWTAVTADGKLSAHFEHSIAITAAGPEILSELGNVQG